MDLHQIDDLLCVSACKLPGSSFEDVDLSGATFKNVKMTDWHVSNVNLSDASVTNANLSGIAIIDCKLDGMTIEGILVTDLMAAYRASKTSSRGACLAWSGAQPMLRHGQSR